jgi:hypothetical protein
VRGNASIHLIAEASRARGNTWGWGHIAGRARERAVDEAVLDYEAALALQRGVAAAIAAGDGFLARLAPRLSADQVRRSWRALKDVRHDANIGALYRERTLWASVPRTI